MSEERDTQAAGAPVDETEVTQTEVQAAVERAAEVAPAGVSETQADPGAAGAAGDSDGIAERPTIAPLVESPSAGPGPSASEIFAASASASHSGAAQVQPVDAPEAASAAAVPPQAAALADRLEADAAAAAVVPAAGTAPAVVPSVAAPSAGLGPVRDGEIRISADHPMAALYMQTPMPPEIKGNRGAGILIALLATLGFAVVFAGVLALIAAPSYPPSTFLTEGLVPALLSWTYLGSLAAFFVGLALLVLISGRAGWWAYVIGGFFVGLLVFAVAFFGTVVDTGEELRSSVGDLLAARLSMGALVVAIIAGVVAREVTVWFGAWIGARGRKVTRKNAAAVAEYEDALAEVQAKNP